jgi:hypothetical protein
MKAQSRNSFTLPSTWALGGVGGGQHHAPAPLFSEERPAYPLAAIIS